MCLYAIANQKGGVGKTTVTLGLSSEIARLGSRVLVIDLDPRLPPRRSWQLTSKSGRPSRM
jgi:cellulose biosynthesis protein BcsQ